MVPMPSIACLEAFECVARHGSVSRAAAELNLTQSAVSRQIHQLEELLDVALFERVKQRVVITDAGRLYLKDVNRVIIDLKDSTSRIMACGGSASLLNLAVLPTFGTRWLVPRLPAFLSKHPGATVNFSTRSSPFDFSVEPFDAAIHYGSPIWPGAVTHHLMDEDTAPVCSPKYEQAQRLRKPADLGRAVLLHQSTRTDAWSEWFAAISGLGVALLPKILIEEELASGKLSLLFDQAVRSASSYYVVVPETKVASPLTHAFTRWVIREAKLGTTAYYS